MCAHTRGRALKAVLAFARGRLRGGFETVVGAVCSRGRGGAGNEPGPGADDYRARRREVEAEVGVHDYHHGATKSLPRLFAPKTPTFCIGYTRAALPPWFRPKGGGRDKAKAAPRDRMGTERGLMGI